MNMIEQTIRDWKCSGEGTTRRVFVVTDTNVDRLVMPLFAEAAPSIAEAERIVISPGEDNKNIRTVESVWRRLMSAEATRNDLLVNVGGGMVSDLGGFAAATFKRGMPYANIATTLLAAADASVGGKTGVNFGGVKNAVGAFAMPLGTEVCYEAFSTLSREEILSGYGEILKMSLVASPESLVSIARVEDNIADLERLGDFARESARLKMAIVDKDPKETGLRKTLNFGHTFGHAFESLALERGHCVAHGIAVAYGIVTALVLSRMLCGFPSELLYFVAKEVVRPYFGSVGMTCSDYPELLAFMHNDKKNSDSGSIRFVLLEDAGRPVCDVSVPDDDVKAALDICRDLLS